MSTYLALTFGTLLSSQGTDTSFGPPSSGPSGRFALSCFQLIRPESVLFADLLSSPLCRPDLTACPTFQTLADPRSEKRIGLDPNAIPINRHAEFAQGRDRARPGEDRDVVFQGIGYLGTVRADRASGAP